MSGERVMEQEAAQAKVSELEQQAKALEARASELAQQAQEAEGAQRRQRRKPRRPRRAHPVWRPHRPPLWARVVRSRSFRRS